MRRETLMADSLVLYDAAGHAAHRRCTRAGLQLLFSSRAQALSRHRLDIVSVVSGAWRVDKTIHRRPSRPIPGMLPGLQAAGSTLSGAEIT